MECGGEDEFSEEKNFSHPKTREEIKIHKSNIWGNCQFPAPIECSIVSSRQFASDGTQLQSHFYLFELFFSSHQTRTRQTASNLINGSRALANISIKKYVYNDFERRNTEKLWITQFSSLTTPPLPSSLLSSASRARDSKKCMENAAEVEKKALYFFFGSRVVESFGKNL